MPDEMHLYEIKLNGEPLTTMWLTEEEAQEVRIKNKRLTVTLTEKGEPNGSNELATESTTRDEEA
jgi:hypothetical protein